LFHSPVLASPGSKVCVSLTPQVGLVIAAAAIVSSINRFEYQ
jgi:hypothetical protein